MCFDNSKHPGAYLNEILESMGMSQKELALRTGFTEKHISTVINGKKGISATFAKKLEFALPQTMRYWMERQSLYDEECQQYQERNGISDEEKKILSNLKTVTAFLQSEDLIDEADNELDKVLALRKFMRVSSLEVIPKISYNAAYRAQVRNNGNVDPYVLYAWKRICEAYVEKMDVADKLDVAVLKDSLDGIKSLMFCDVSQIEEKLIDILAKCGIAFRVVPHFRGAPVQGFISKRTDGKLMMCVTLRQKRADKVWFTIFHEIGHIINGDADLKFVDFDDAKSDAEQAADQFAGNILLNPHQYREFWQNGDFSLSSIKKFAVSQKVKPYIVIGRLQSAGELDWSAYADEMVYYDWVKGSHEAA